ncbi:hypothetical protein K469DRAFT_399965 [Zopfia rhizophila CBS 207.26]|uniref:Rhodopsin domain-containing protein n=1 Tax=Zopfia rhizophila CBS 207.26 TaxID=1314779 RepID=A0A6A6DEC7_9PEZI|nr:hypothetical protein K469DRAFT_399965 [Zopfia rhizophila CBS 207.26]
MPTPPSHEDIAYMLAHEDDDRRLWFIGVNAACLGVAYVAIGLRFLCRYRVGTKAGWDDWLIMIAGFLVTGHVACLFQTVKFGMGRHAVPHVTDIKGFALTALIAQTFYNLAIPAVKLSILSLYSRIFHRTTGWFTPTLYVTALFVFLYTIPQCFAYIFQCVPIESLWRDLGPGMKVYCINFKAVIIVFGIINIVTDWWILALPIPVVLGLRMEKRTKWSLCALFLLGGFVCVISIIRLLLRSRWRRSIQAGTTHPSPQSPL